MQRVTAVVAIFGVCIVPTLGCGGTHPTTAPVSAAQSGSSAPTTPDRTTPTSPDKASTSPPPSTAAMTPQVRAGSPAPVTMMNTPSTKPMAGAGGAAVLPTTMPAAVSGGMGSAGSASASSSN